MANVSRLQIGNSSNLPAESIPPLPGPPGGGGDDGGSGLSIRQILGTLRRRKLLIGGIAVIGTTIAWLIANQLTPIYQAQADVVVEPRVSDVMRSSPDYAQQPLDALVAGPVKEGAVLVERGDVCNGRGSGLGRRLERNVRRRRPQGQLRDPASPRCRGASGDVGSAATQIQRG